MANSRIPDLTNYTNPDGTNDVIPIWDNANSQTKKITRNNYLGITGSPVGSSDSQVLSNKTLGNTNTLTIKDNLFTLQDNGDVTKQGQFDLSGNTTGTTRTYTLPNATGTLVDLASSQTLTNKTLTSPVISGGSIDNSTVTIDALTGHSSANTGTIYGVAITSSVFSGNNIVPNNSLSNTGSFGSAWAFTTYVPTWTNLTIGNGTNASKYTQIGKVVVVRLSFTLGSTSSIGSNAFFTLPITSASLGTEESLGVLSYYDLSATSGYQLIAAWRSTTTANLRVPQSSGSGVLHGGTTATAPVAFGTGDVLQGYFMYESA